MLPSSGQIVKLYGWEPPLVTRVHDARERELLLMSQANLTGAASSTMSILCPYIVSDIPVLLELYAVEHFCSFEGM